MTRDQLDLREIFRGAALALLLIGSGALFCLLTRQVIQPPPVWHATVLCEPSYAGLNEAMATARRGMVREGAYKQRSGLLKLEVNLHLAHRDAASGSESRSESESEKKP